MKTRIYSALLFTLLFTGAFILNSCKNDRDCTHATQDINLTTSDKSKVPYTGSDKLTFVRTSLGDTHTFYGAGIVTDYGQYTTQGDCYRYKRFQREYIIFQSPTFSNPIVIELSFPNTSSITSCLYISFQNVNFITFPIRIPSFNDYDSLTVQNKTYYKIHAFSNENTFPIPTNHMCYYNLPYGILKMIFPNGETWELLDKK
jgi:hypothetical protein